LKDDLFALIECPLVKAAVAHWINIGLKARCMMNQVEMAGGRMPNWLNREMNIFRRSSSGIKEYFPDLVLNLLFRPVWMLEP